MRPRRLILATAVLIASACATTGGSGAGPAIEGATWRLVEAAGTPAPTPEGDRYAYVRLLADSARAEGNGGCNRMSGPFTRAGDSLSFGPMISTKMACAEEARNRAEVAFMGALERTRSYRLNADTLALLGDGGDVLARLVREPR